MASRRQGKYRLTAAELADVEDSRHQKSSGPSRKGLFYWLDQTKEGGKEGTFLILPEIKPRGPRGIRTWYLAQGIHRVEIQGRDSDKPHSEGKPCWTYMRDEQPNHLQQLIETTDLTDEQCRCFFCEFVEAFVEGKENALPKQRNPKTGQTFNRPVYDVEVNFNFPVLLPEDTYEDDDQNMVKIHAGRYTVVTSISAKMKYYPDLLDPTFNQWIHVELRDRRYHAEVLPQEYCEEAGLNLWLDDWENQIPDLEEMATNQTPWTYDEQRAYMEEQEPDLYQQFLARTGEKSLPKSTGKSSPKAGRKSTTSRTSRSKTTTTKKTTRRKK